MTGTTAADIVLIPSVAVELSIDDPRWQDMILTTAVAKPGAINIDIVINTAWRTAWRTGWGARWQSRQPDDPPAPAFEVAMKLTSDRELQRLNRVFRGKDQPTNVLSFPSGALREADRSTAPFPQAGIFLGDVALSIDTVIKEAKERAITPAAHMAHLTIHAMLHLLGWTHDTEPAALAMETLETEILAELGIANPYHANDL